MYINVCIFNTIKKLTKQKSKKIVKEERKAFSKKADQLIDYAIHKLMKNTSIQVHRRISHLLEKELNVVH